jgi:hypothetical protein
MRQVRTELTAHVGGKPNFVQRMLIERAVILTLRCAQIDDMIMADKKILSQMDTNQGIAWQNALRRTLIALGVDPAATAPPTLAEVMAEATRERLGGQDAA